VYLEGKKRKSTCLAPSPGRPYSEPRGRIVEKQGVFDEEFLNLGATDGELERLHGRPRYANAGISRLQGAKQVRGEMGYAIVRKGKVVEFEMLLMN